MPDAGAALRLRGIASLNLATTRPLMRGPPGNCASRYFDVFRSAAAPVMRLLAEIKKQFVPNIFNPGFHVFGHIEQDIDDFMNHLSAPLSATWHGQVDAARCGASGQFGNSCSGGLIWEHEGGFARRRTSLKNPIMVIRHGGVCLPTDAQPGLK